MHITVIDGIIIHLETEPLTNVVSLKETCLSNKEAFWLKKRMMVFALVERIMSHAQYRVSRIIGA